MSWWEYLLTGVGGLTLCYFGYQLAVAIVVMWTWK
jgi:hypothetical protein